MKILYHIDQIFETKKYCLLPNGATYSDLLDQVVPAGVLKKI